MNAIEKYEAALTALDQGLMSLDDFEKEIAPLRDVVPVVRCKDCKHWQHGMIGMGCYWDADYPHEENDFCSHAKRREE